jgi:hypothetical protein
LQKNSSSTRTPKFAWKDINLALLCLKCVHLWEGNASLPQNLLQHTPSTSRDFWESQKKKKKVNWSHQIRKKKYSLLWKKYTAKRVPNRNKSVFKNLQLVAATLSCLKSLSSIPSWHRKLMLTVGKTKIMCTLDVSFLLEWDKGLPWTLLCLSPASTWLSMTFYCHGKP